MEKLDLIGIEFLWRICLECQSTVVAGSAISTLVRYSYVNVSQKLKKDVVQLHSKFLNECYRRLNVSLFPWELCEKLLEIKPPHLTAFHYFVSFRKKMRWSQKLLSLSLGQGNLINWGAITIKKKSPSIIYKRFRCDLAQNKTSEICLW